MPRCRIFIAAGVVASIIILSPLLIPPSYVSPLSFAASKFVITRETCLGPLSCEKVGEGGVKGEGGKVGAVRWVFPTSARACLLLLGCFVRWPSLLICF